MPSLPHRPDVLFGRQPDLDHLHAQTGSSGITAVVGRPQLGKSWLLAEFAHQLAEQDGGPLVGYAASSGEGGLLLRAAKNLYEHWLADEPNLERVKRNLEQKRGELLPSVVGAVGTAIAAIDATGISAAVNQAFNRLVSGSDTASGIQVSALQYEQARDLVRAAALASGRPVVVILDQWDESPNRDHETILLKQVLRDIEEWPTCRVLIGIADGTTAASRFDTNIRKADSTQAERFDLPFMHLADSRERERLLDRLHNEVPVTTQVDADTLLNWVGGNPAVLRRWRNKARPPETVDGLSELAREAHAYLYTELDSAIPELDSELGALAIRLALLPLATGEDRSLYEPFEPIILQNRPATDLDALRKAGVLEDADPPTFGHPRRRDVAGAALETDRPNLVRTELDRLARHVAARIHGTDHESGGFVIALSQLKEVAGKFARDPVTGAVIQAAISLLPDQAADPDAVLRGAGELTDGEQDCAPLLAMGLFNTLNDAQRQDDRTRRDALLDQLRALALNQPEPAVRENLAKGLFNTLNDALQQDDRTRRDALLDQLRALAQNHPESALREQFARGLAATMYAARADLSRERFGALQEELRPLVAELPADHVVNRYLRDLDGGS